MDHKHFGMVTRMDADQILKRARNTLDRLADFKVEHRVDDEPLILRRDWIPPRLRKPERPASGLIFKDAPQESPQSLCEFVDVDYLQRAMESMASVLGEEVALIEMRIVERQSDEIAALRDLVQRLIERVDMLEDQMTALEADIVDRGNVKPVRRNDAA